jgi:hypothetical protein
MFSPIYTPFSREEVRSVLGLSRVGYDRAIYQGKLERSVHFDGRVSFSTSLHSLVDVVSFDVQCSEARRIFSQDEWIELSDYYLSEMCTLDEQCEGFNLAALTGNEAQVLAMLTNGHTSVASYPTGAAELRVSATFAASWCRYYRALNRLVLEDGSGSMKVKRATRSMSRNECMLTSGNCGVATVDVTASRLIEYQSQKMNSVELQHR